MPIAEPEVTAEKELDINKFFGWKVIVLNDDHNSFDHVASTISTVIPGISLEEGYQIAGKIHTLGLETVYSGLKEHAHSYWTQLKAAGLTMAPLEQD